MEKNGKGDIKDLGDRLTPETWASFWHPIAGCDDRAASVLRANLLTLLENTEDCILFSDIKGYPVFFNSNYARIVEEAFGIRMIPGLKPHRMLPQAEKDLWEAFHCRVLGGEDFSTECSHAFPDGQTRCFRFHFKPIRIQDRIVGFSEVSREITERKNAENRILAQRDLALCLGAVRDLAHGIRLCLNAALDMTEMDSGGIYLLEDDSGDFVLAAHRGLKSPFVRTVSRYRSDSEPACIMKEGKSLFVSKITPDVPMADALLAEGIGSFYCVPFRHGGRTLGAINLASHEGKPDSPRDFTALEVVSAQIGGVVHRLGAEEALRRQNHLLKTFLDHSPATIFIRDRDGRHILCSRRLEELLGMSENEILGKTAEEVFPPALAQRTRQNDRQALEAGKAIHLEDQLGPAGLERDFHVIKYPIFLEGKSAPAVCTIATDITDLRRAETALRRTEEHLRSLMETATRFAVYGLRIDPDAAEGLRVCFASPSIRELMGVSDPMDMNGWFANVLPEDRERVRRANRQALKSRRFDEVMRVRLPDSGEVRWLHAVATAVAEENGGPEYVNGILIDITEQKRVEEALSDRERKLVAESEKLREINVALRVLLKKRAEDRVELEEKVLANVTELIQPHLEKARSRVSDPRARVHLDIAKENLEQISSSFARKLTSRSFRLTPAEIQVAHLVRQGDNTKKIARHLNISPKTVEVHRLNIRKKLRIAGQRVNLRTFLLNLD